jgi:predicted transcriptional regulator
MMAIMAVGLLTSTATAIFASEGARFAILLAVMGPLIAITQRGEGGIFTRGRLLGFIEAHPGIHFSALRDALELGNGVTAHHIQILEKEGRVISWMDGRVRRFASSGVDQSRLQEIQNPVTGMQIAILQVLSESGALGIHTGELRTKLATSRQLLSYHMKQLSERNFVKSSGRGRSLRWNLLEEGQKKLDNSTHLTNV